MRKRTLEVEQLTLWVLRLQAVNDWVVVARKFSSTLVRMKLEMLDYASFPLHSRKWMLFFDLFDSIAARRWATMANHGFNQAEHSNMQAQCSLKLVSSPSSVFCSTTSCFIFTHQLSQRSYSTCRIEHTFSLHLKNINASLITSRPESYQQIRRIGQKVSESMLWLSEGRLTHLLHLKTQRANQTMNTLVNRDVHRDFRRTRRQLRWIRYEDSCSTKIVNSQSN